MDPTANIDEQRQVVDSINKIVDNCSDNGEYTSGQADELCGLAARLAELFEAVDHWIVSGGNLPDQWDV